MTNDPPATPTRSVAIPVRPPADLRSLRLLVFVYLALWVFEGALRKWILPGLANPLLIVRDPFLLLMYGLALTKGVFPRNAFIVWIVVIAIAALVVSIGMTTTPLSVELFGFRSDFMHLPLVFVLPAIVRREDLRTIGRWFLIVSIPMAALVILQFESGRNSFLNTGAGAGSRMLESTSGHIRPSGTFSYTNGLGTFTSLALAFFLYHLLEKRVFPRLLWLACIPTLLTLVVLSGSRGAAGIIGIMIVTVLGMSVVQGRYRVSAIKLAAVLAVAVFVVGSIAVFKQGLHIFASRFGSASNVQTGFVGRFTDSFLKPYEVAGDTGWAGLGLGMGTNVASGLMIGKRTFMVAEEEGARVILESGPLIGTAFLLLRWALAAYLAFFAWRALRRHAATLPLLLFSTCFYSVMLGQFAQSTELGFATIAAGLCLTASRLAGKPVLVSTEAAAEGIDAPLTAPPARLSRLSPAARPEPAPLPEAPPPRARGRSAYAERLHGSDPQGPTS